MNRKEFLEQIARYSLCASAGLLMGETVLRAEEPKAAVFFEDTAKTKMGHWISDLVSNAKDTEDRKDVARLLKSCGRSCYRREMAPPAPEVKGNLDAFIAQFQKMLGAENVKRDGNVAHVNFNLPFGSCPCLVAKFVPAQPNDLFCNCSCGWVQAAFEVAINKIPQVECLESLRRGGKTCRFDVKIS